MTPPGIEPPSSRPLVNTLIAPKYMHQGQKSWLCHRLSVIKNNFQPFILTLSADLTIRWLYPLPKVVSLTFMIWLDMTFMIWLDMTFNWCSSQFWSSGEYGVTFHFYYSYTHCNSEMYYLLWSTHLVEMICLKMIIIQIRVKKNKIKNETKRKRKKKHEVRI